MTYGFEITTKVADGVTVVKKNLFPLTESEAKKQLGATIDYMFTHCRNVVILNARITSKA